MGTDLADLVRAEVPTFGHLLEDGFCSQAVRLLTGAERMIGTASTLRVVGNDAVAVDEALERLRPGEVLVVEMADDKLHAPFGAVARARALARGAAGVVVDGPVTDIDALTQPDPDGFVLPVYATGTTCLTTKRRRSGCSQYGVDVLVGGTLVRSGDVVLGDRNGVIAAAEARLRAVLDAAIASDTAEPALLETIRTGRPSTTRAREDGRCSRQGT